jgi:serine protease Do
MVACGLSNPICEVDRAPPSSSLNNAPRSDPLPAPIHGKFGIKYRNVDRDTALKLGLSTMRGALVIGTVVGSPAARAGIIVGDVIVQINGVNVNEPSDFAKVASEVLIGDEIPIIVIRDRKQLRFLSGVALLDPNLTSNSQDNSPAQNQFEQWLKTP